MNPQNTSLVRDYLEKSHPAFFYIFILLFQLLFTFQGMDLADSGFNAVFYQQIFENPKSVEYNFMFWLTGITGGIFYKGFSFLGLWGFRLLGVLVNTITIWLCYRLLIRHLPKIHTMIGLFIVVLTLNNEIKELNYNIMSGMMNMLIITLLYQSAISRKPTPLLFLTGMICSINILTRIPNLLSAGFFLAFLFYQLAKGSNLSSIFKATSVFAVGFVSGLLFDYFVLLQLGHWEYFKYALGIVFNLANNNLPAEEAATNSYGALTLVKQCIYQTTQSVAYAFFLLIFLLFIYLLSYFAAQKNRYLKFGARATATLLALLVAGVFYKGVMSYRPTLFIYTGLSLLFSLYWLIQNQNKEAKLLAALGIFLLLYFPFGSSFGLVTAGRYSFWIALPMAISIFLQFKGIETSIATRINESIRSLRFSLEASHVRIAKGSFLALALISGLYFCYYYPFFDWRDRRLMTHGFTNPHLKGIYTTKGRANAVNELLSATATYAQPGTLLLAYDDIPMINYATETVPFMNNSMPWLYPAPLFERELHAAAAFHKKMPVIVRQKIKTFGDGSEWPEKLLPQPYADWEVNRERNKVMNAFIMENNYKIVWSNNYFEILIP